MRSTLAITIILSLVHALIDACCAVTVHNTRLFHHLTGPQGFYLILIYDLIAFGSQAFFGIFVDKFRVPKNAALVGILLTALGLTLIPVNSTAAAILAGTGNALFHISAGALVLYLDFGRASLSGLFVAPGALGLAYGIWFGKAGQMIQWPFLLLLFAAFFIVRRLQSPAIEYDRPSDRSNGATAAVLLLILFAVAVRSFGGGLGNTFAPKGASFGFALAGAAFAGKAVGGFLADRFGWIKVCALSLLVSAILVYAGFQDFRLLLAAIFLFQIPMPVTLVAVARLFPRMPAFAFGLTCLALILGSLPMFFMLFQEYYSPDIFAWLTLSAAAAIVVGLRMLKPASASTPS